MRIDEYSILRKKQKKNAFAATALLISIAIALLVMVGAVLILSKVNDSDHVKAYDNGNVEEKSNNNSTTCEGLVKEIVFNDNLTTIKEAAISYFTNERLPKEIGDTVKITLSEMKNKRLVRNVIDASANTCDGNKSYVEVTKEEYEYVMKVFLSCSDIEDYIVVHLGCYDYCDKDVCEKKEEVPKTYEYEYKKTTSCTMSPWSNWGNWKTTREKTSNLKKEDTKVETSKKETVDTTKATANVSYNCDKYSGYTLVGTSCVKSTTITDKKAATKNAATYNCDKYGKDYKLVGTECVKNYTVTDTKDATKNAATYNCDKYGKDYKLVGTECIKNYTVTDTKDATKNAATYNCDKYGKDYKLVGTECVKNYTVTDTKDATKNAATYNCDKYSGYTLSGTECVKSTKSTDTKDANLTYNCNKYSGYTLSGKNCVRKTTVTKEADPVYSTKTKTQYYTCYKQECTTKTVFSCPTLDTCGNQLVTSCENVKKTCSKKVEEKYVSDYTCPSDYTKVEKDGKYICTKTVTDTKSATPVYDCNKYSGYTLNGTKCVKGVTTTDKKAATKNPDTYNCNNYSGYKLSGTKCIKDVATTDKKAATKNPDTYNCNNYSGYKLSGTKCVKDIATTDKKAATKNPDTYNCNNYSGYKLSGTKCIKDVATTDKKAATKNPDTYNCNKYSGYELSGTSCVKTTASTDKLDATKKVTYSCPIGYTLNDTTCTKKNTETIKTTYYRYATRTCKGGSVSTKWSTSKNDSILKSEGYKLTGAKREIKDIVK